MFNQTMPATPNQLPVNPLSHYLRQPTPMVYQRFESIRHGILIEDCATKMCQDLHEILQEFVDNLRLLTPQIRSIVIKEQNPEASIHYPLVFPFRYENDILTETIEGNKRHISFFENDPIKLRRYKEIPLNEISPLSYTSSIFKL